jgi:hypothetical protein
MVTNTKQIDPFGGDIKLPDGSTLRDRLKTPTYQDTFQKYQDRLSPYLYQAPKLDFFDVASELGAAILSTPSTGNVFEGIGRGFANVSTRVRQAREDNMKANQQMGMQVASLAMQDEQRAQDYMDKYSFELLKLANDPGEMITLEFDEYIPEVDTNGDPVFETDADGSPILGSDKQPIQKQVPSGKRMKRSFRNNAANKRFIDALLQRNGVKIGDAQAVTNVYGDNKADAEYTKAILASDKEINTEAGAASGVRDQVAYARKIAQDLGPEGYGSVQNFLVPIKKVLLGMGLGGMIDESRLGDQILMNQVGLGFTMSLVGQTKGAISNKEMDMFLAGSPSLASTYDGFMKQLKYLDRIAKRSEDFQLAYAAEGARIDELRKTEKVSKSSEKRQLDIFKTKWKRENPLFETPEELLDIQEHAAGKDYSKDYNYQAGKQTYRSTQAAKTFPTNTQSVAEQSSSLADKVVKGSGTRAEKTIQLQDMIDKGLPVPEWMIQAYELTPKSD